MAMYEREPKKNLEVDLGKLKLEEHLHPGFETFGAHDQPVTHQVRNPKGHVPKPVFKELKKPTAQVRVHSGAKIFTRHPQPVVGMGEPTLVNGAEIPPRPSEQKDIDNRPGNIEELEKERLKRQNNIVLLNFPMQPASPESMKSTVADFFKKTLKVHVHIVGVSMRGNPRGWKGTAHLQVRLLNLDDKKAILTCAGRLRGSGIILTSDLCDKDIDTRRKLLSHMKKARAEGKHANVEDDTMTLFIDRIPFVIDGDDLVQRT